MNTCYTYIERVLFATDHLDNIHSISMLNLGQFSQVIILLVDISVRNIMPLTPSTEYHNVSRFKTELTVGSLRMLYPEGEMLINNNNQQV